MKKILLIVLSLSFWTTTFCQDEFIIPKSTILIGGNASFSYSISDFEKNISSLIINISPSAGYAFKDNLILGGNLSFNYNDRTDIDIYSVTLGTGIYLKKYTEKHLFYKAGCFYARGIADNIISKNNSTLIGIIPSIGYSIKLNPNTLFEVSLNNNFYFTKLNPNDSFTIGNSTSLGCGLQILL